MTPTDEIISTTGSLAQLVFDKAYGGAVAVSVRRGRAADTGLSTRTVVREVGDEVKRFDALL